MVRLISSKLYDEFIFIASMDYVCVWQKQWRKKWKFQSAQRPIKNLGSTNAPACLYPSSSNDTPEGLTKYERVRNSSVVFRKDQTVLDE